VFFIATAVAALAGGTVHGFFSAQGSLGHRMLWPLGLIMIGLAALAFTNVGTAISLSGPTALAVSRSALVLFLLYSVVVLFFDERFVVAIAAYMPAVLFLGWVFLEQFRRTRRPAFAWGMAGIGITLLSSGHPAGQDRDSSALLQPQRLISHVPGRGTAHDLPRGS
jgi:hypothetical protein